MHCDPRCDIYNAALGALRKKGGSSICVRLACRGNATNLFSSMPISTFRAALAKTATSIGSTSNSTAGVNVSVLSDSTFPSQTDTAPCTRIAFISVLGYLATLDSSVYTVYLGLRFFGFLIMIISLLLGLQSFFVKGSAVNPRQLRFLRYLVPSIVPRPVGWWWRGVPECCYPLSRRSMVLFMRSGPLCRVLGCWLHGWRFCSRLKLVARASIDWRFVRLR